MASFDHTIELERSILKILTASRVHLKTYVHLLREEYFTSPERRFIFEVIVNTNTSGGIVTRNIYEYEVGSRIADEEASFFITEWNIVENALASEHPESLIERLEKAHAGRQISKLGDEVDELLEAGDIEEALAILKRGAVTIGGVTREDKPVSELTDISRRLKAIEDKKAHPEKYMGLQTGFRKFDNLTGGLFPGELTLIAGITGTGKSTLVRRIQKGIVTLNPGKNVLHIANEEYLEQVEHKFDSVFTGIPYLNFKRANITTEDLNRWQEYMQNWQAGRVFIKEVPAFTDVTLVEQAYRELEARGIKIHAITIDHLPHVKPIQKYFDQNDERAKAAADCKEIARWLHVPVIIPTQAATELEKKQMRGSHGDKLDVYGSKAQVHVANTFILITVRGTIDENDGKEEWERDVRWTCAIKKNRDGPSFWFKARHYVQTGNIEQDGVGGMGDVPDEDNASTNKDDKNVVKLHDADKDDISGVILEKPTSVARSHLLNMAEKARKKVKDKDA